MVWAPRSCVVRAATPPALADGFFGTVFDREHCRAEGTKSSSESPLSFVAPLSSVALEDGVSGFRLQAAPRISPDKKRA
jgi:hypothetical protein